MNYKHAYHAGHFTDVVKHVVLTALLTALQRKNTPFCYIDTHAGTGYYDLFSEAAKKKQEYKGGIEKVIQQGNPPPLVKRYLHCVHEINNHLVHATFGSLQYYPGSPLIARHLCRPQDRIIACELQLETYQALKATFAGDKQAAVHHMDGFLGLKAFLPPKERRGLVLIDPPYEDPDEFTHIVHTLPSALKRWPSGIFAIWYPIKNESQLTRFYRTLKTEVAYPSLIVEFTIYPDLANHLNGCGMVIINPPWQFDLTLEELLPWLWNSLSINGQGGFHTYFL